MCDSTSDASRRASNPSLQASDGAGFLIEQVYIQGVGKQNEDAIMSRPDLGLFAVIDGATALQANPDLSGAVAATAVKEALEQWDGKSSLIDAVITANRYLGSVTGGGSVEKSARPSCCIAAIRWRDAALEFVQVGDCMAFAEYPDDDGQRPDDDEQFANGTSEYPHDASEYLHDTSECLDDAAEYPSGDRHIAGLVRVLTHDSVAAFDSESVQMLVEAWDRHLSRSNTDAGKVSGEGLHTQCENTLTPTLGAERARQISDLPVEKQRETLAAIRTELRPVLVSHRDMMNVPGGYSVLDGSPAAEQFIEHGVINASLISRVLLVSDGLQLPTGKLDKHNSWLETAETAFRHGVEGLATIVLRLEDADEGCYIYPRLKAHDDKSGLLIERRGSQS